MIGWGIWGRSGAFWLDSLGGGNCIEPAFKESFPAFSPCGTNRKWDQLAGSLGQMGKAALGWEHRPGRIPVAPAPSGCNTGLRGIIISLHTTWEALTWRKSNLSRWVGEGKLQVHRHRADRSKCLAYSDNMLISCLVGTQGAIRELWLRRQAEARDVGALGGMLQHKELIPQSTKCLSELPIYGAEPCVWVGGGESSHF